MFERILIAVDFSPASLRAIHFGNQLAKKCNSEEFVVYVLSFLANREQASRFIVPGIDWLTVFRRELDEFVEPKPYSRRTLDVLVNEHPDLEILKYSQDNSCQLVVVGSHGHSSFVNTLLGSVTQKLMRNSNVPLMIVPSSITEDRELKFENILVPTDFSTISLKAMRLGIELARKWNSTLHVVHVADLKSIREMEQMEEPRFFKIKDLDVTPTLRETLEGLEFTGVSELSTLYGDPNVEILNYSKDHNIDFIVMGSHGRKGLDRILIGSTAAPLVRHSRTPIFTLSEPVQACQEQESVSTNTHHD